MKSEVKEEFFNRKAVADDDDNSFGEFGNSETQVESIHVTPSYETHRLRNPSQSIGDAVGLSVRRTRPVARCGLSTYDEAPTKRIRNGVQVTQVPPQWTISPRLPVQQTSPGRRNMTRRDVGDVRRPSTSSHVDDVVATVLQRNARSLLLHDQPVEKDNCELETGRGPPVARVFQRNARSHLLHDQPPTEEGGCTLATDRGPPQLKASVAKRVRRFAPVGSVVASSSTSDDAVRVTHLFDDVIDDMRERFCGEPQPPPKKRPVGLPPSTLLKHMLRAATGSGREELTQTASVDVTDGRQPVLVRTAAGRPLVRMRRKPASAADHDDSAPTLSPDEAGTRVHMLEQQVRPSDEAPSLQRSAPQNRIYLQSNPTTAMGRRIFRGPSSTDPSRRECTDGAQVRSLMSNQLRSAKRQSTVGLSTSAIICTAGEEDCTSLSEPSSSQDDDVKPPRSLVEILPKRVTTAVGQQYSYCPSNVPQSTSPSVMPMSSHTQMRGSRPSAARKVSNRRNVGLQVWRVTPAFERGTWADLDLEDLSDALTQRQDVFDAETQTPMFPKFESVAPVLFKDSVEAYKGKSLSANTTALKVMSNAILYFQYRGSLSFMLEASTALGTNAKNLKKLETKNRFDPEFLAKLVERKKKLAEILEREAKERHARTAVKTPQAYLAENAQRQTIIAEVQQACEALQRQQRRGVPAQAALRARSSAVRRPL